SSTRLCCALDARALLNFSARVLLLRFGISKKSLNPSKAIKRFSRCTSERIELGERNMLLPDDRLKLPAIRVHLVARHQVAWPSDPFDDCFDWYQGWVFVLKPHSVFEAGFLRHILRESLVPAV